MLEIRANLTDLLRRDGLGDELADSMQAMRAACRRFLGAIGDPRDIQQHIFYMGTRAWIFLSALGELRGVFGIQIAQLASSYKVDVPDELVPLLPLEPADDDN